MINATQLQLRLIGLGVLVLVIISIIILVLYSAFAPRDQSLDSIEGAPTPILASPTPGDPKSHQFTPLQKTTIEQTTDEQIPQQNEVLSKRKVGGATIYTIRSEEPGKTDEIRTKDGIVVFEKTSTKTNAAPLPKIATIKSKYGNPEETLDKVGEGFYMSAYLYPTKGFAIYANKYTGSVYVIQRFLSMTLADYKKQYGENLSPAPAMPKEFQEL